MPVTDPTLTTAASAPAAQNPRTLGALELRPPPASLPDPNVSPPTFAESGDPFATVRILHLIARIQRGRPVLLDALVDHLNATYLDWMFSRSVVADAVLQLQANWMTDYRNSSGIVIDESPYGPAVTIEDSARVDPWIVRQVARQMAACREQLLAFSRLDRPTSGG